MNRNVIITTESATLLQLSNYEDAIERLFKLFQVSLNVLPAKAEHLKKYTDFILKLFTSYTNDQGISPETKFYPLSLLLRQRMLTILKTIPSGYCSILDQIYYPYCHVEMDIIKPALEQCLDRWLSKTQINIHSYLKATHIAIDKILKN